jgi:hypothetical protein
VVDYAEMLRQHESVLADVDRLELLVGSPPSDVSPARLRELMLGDAESLRTDLARHFAHEEEGGYLQVVLDTHPGMERRIEKLRSDHGTILRSLDAVTMGAGEIPMDDLRRELRAALSLLREHEAAETELMHQTVIQDEGTPD